MRSAARRHDPDAELEDEIQRAMWEQHEISMACEPWFDGSAYKPTPDELATQDAYLEGQRAGHLGKHAGENPWQSDVPQHASWELGRKAVIG